MTEVAVDKPIRLAVLQDRGWRTGEAIYTSLRWGYGPPATWPFHCERLAGGLAALGLPTVDWPALQQTVQTAVDTTRQNQGWQQQAHARVRITVLAADHADAVGVPWLAGPAAETAVQIDVAPTALDPVLPVLPPAFLEIGGAIRDPQRRLAGHKLVGMAEDLAHRYKAQQLGADDAVLLRWPPRRPPMLSEATTASLLVLNALEDWCTPGPEAAPVYSTTLAALRAGGLAVADAHLAVEVFAWKSWKGAWLLSAVHGARPIGQLGRAKVQQSAFPLQELLAPWLLPPAGP
jgi:branched-subunit amino acid aminotransferase/4-amino-4-deoxychorismate lyase